MALQFGRARMQINQRRTRQFELPARFDRNRPAADRISQPDDRRPVHDRFPAALLRQCIQQSPDAMWPAIGYRLGRAGQERNLFMLGADPELGDRLGALFKPGDQLVAALNRGGIKLVAGHNFFRLQQVTNVTRQGSQSEAGKM